MVHSARFLLVLAFVLGGCGECGDEPNPWVLDESVDLDEHAPFDEHAAFDDPILIDLNAPACETSRRFIASLELVDEETLERRPDEEVVEIHEDAGADGSVERCWVRLYDEHGRQVISTQDTYDPPGPDSIYLVLDFDERYDKPTVSRADTNGDGVFDYEVRSEYDEGGNIVASTTDDGIDGSIDRQGWYSYDAHGFRTRQELDKDGDGIVDAYDVFETDNTGRITRWDGDWDADGVWDQHMIWTFEGREIVEFWEETRRGDELETVRVRTELDADGRPVRSETDYGDDGTVDMLEERLHSGDITTRLLDFENDGVFDNVEVTHWRDAREWPPRPTLIEDDYDYDGSLDQLRRFVYDSEGRHFVFEWLDPETREPRHRQTQVRGARSR